MEGQQVKVAKSNKGRAVKKTKEDSPRSWKPAQDTHVN